MFGKRPMDFLPGMWWEYTDKSAERYCVISSTDFLPEV